MLRGGQVDPLVKSGEMMGVLMRIVFGDPSFGGTLPRDLKDYPIDRSPGLAWKIFDCLMFCGGVVAVFFLGGSVGMCS